MFIKQPELILNYDLCVRCVCLSVGVFSFLCVSHNLLLEVSVMVLLIKQADRQKNQS